MKTKLTTTEKRASNLCESIRDTATHGGKYPVEVEWITSRTWGSNPRVMYRGEKCTNISGCGYCKHSAALASALCYLGETEEQQHAIARTGGAGVSSVAEALAAQGWKLESVASGRAHDSYHVTRI